MNNKFANAHRIAKNSPASSIFSFTFIFLATLATSSTETIEKTTSPYRVTLCDRGPYALYHGGGS
eukprot:COSAG06_NODE_5999_length_3162_cov_3.330069_3_plen_64_part_01